MSSSLLVLSFGTAACIVVLISCGGVVLIMVLVITELLHRTFKVRCIAVSDHMDEPDNYG